MSERSSAERVAKAFGAVALAAIAAVAIAACGSASTQTGGASTQTATGSAAQTSPLVVGLSSFPPTVAVIADFNAGATAEAAKQHVTLRVADAPDAPSQQSAIATLLGEGANVLAIDPNDSKAIATSVEQANGKHIPVIMLIGADLGGGHTATFIGSNELVGGEKIADYADQVVHGSGEIAEITGDLVHQAFILRNRGFRTELRKYPGVKLVAFGEAGDTTPPAEAMAREMLTAHPQLKVIVGFTDATAAGIYEAVKALGKTASVAVTGYNGDCPTLRSIWENQINATYFQNWYGFGQEAIDSAMALHAGRAVPANIIEPALVLNRAGMQQVMAGTYPVKDSALLASVKQAVDNACPKS